MRSEAVNDWSTGISQAKQLGNFVESLSGSIIAGMADIFIGPAFVLLRGEIKVRVSSRNHQSQHRKLQFVVAFLPLLQQNRMDVTFEVVDGNQRLVESEGQRFGIADADQ